MYIRKCKEKYKWYSSVFRFFDPTKIICSCCVCDKRRIFHFSFFFKVPFFSSWNERLFIYSFMLFGFFTFSCWQLILIKILPLKKYMGFVHFADDVDLYQANEINELDDGVYFAYIYLGLWPIVIYPIHFSWGVNFLWKTKTNQIMIYNWFGNLFHFEKTLHRQIVMIWKLF
jgi:hypothetical protein